MSPTPYERATQCTKIHIPDGKPLAEVHPNPLERPRGDNLTPPVEVEVALSHQQQAIVTRLTYIICGCVDEIVSVCGDGNAEHSGEVVVR